MKKSTSKITKISKFETSEITSKKPTHFARKRAYTNPSFPFLKFNLFKTYEENKQDYYRTIGSVFNGTYKNIFEAYNASHCF